MENKSPLRTLYAVQLFTIVVLILLLIQQILPFFGIVPIGKQLPAGMPYKTLPPGGYVSPSNHQLHGLDSASLARALRSRMIVNTGL